MKCNRKIFLYKTIFFLLSFFGNKMIIFKILNILRITIEFCIFENYNQLEPNQIRLQISNYINMKNHKSPFESQELQEDADLHDIFKMLVELDKTKKTLESNPQLSNRSHQSKKRDQDHLISDESEPLPKSMSIKFPIINKKNHTPIKEGSLISQVEDILNHRSNMSVQSLEQRQSSVSSMKIHSSSKESFIAKEATEKIVEKTKMVNDLERQLQQYKQKYNVKQKAFLLEKQKQKTVLSNILKQSNQQKIKYYQYLEHIDIERKNIVKQEIMEKNQILLKNFKEEELKYKPKKKVKNTQTVSISDEEENKFSQSIEKQKKHYYSVIGSKIEKEKEKYENMFLSQYIKKISTLSEERKLFFERQQRLIQIKPLCIIEGSNIKIEQILAANLEKCIQVRIKCIKFNPTTLNSQRTTIYQIFLELFSSGKKLISSCKNHIFNQKSPIFIPLADIIYKEDEIILINELSHSYFPLQSFLTRLQLSPGEQHLHIVRYIVRVCLKAIQQVNSQLKHDNVIFLPQNLYFDEKWELKFSNITLNQVFFHHFKHIFHENDYFYFPPEEKSDKYSISLWSLGILTYFLCFSGKPFQKYEPYHWKSRQQFFMFNQLHVTSRSNSYDKCKDFIMVCLNKKGNININEIYGEYLFTQTK